MNNKFFLQGILFNRPFAAAQICGRGIDGIAEFYRMNNKVAVVTNVSGLPQTPTNIFGFHIHAGGGCGGTPEDPFSETGTHYNPDNTEHPNHAGDLPPLFSNNGKAFLVVLTDRFSPCEIIGKTVVIHDMPDDFKTQPSGASGKKIACGIIKQIG